MVGDFQYEVIHRLEHEYGAKCTYENFPCAQSLLGKPSDAKVMNLKNLDEFNKNFSSRQIWLVTFLLT
jgi:peptide chain release factor 3